MTSYHMSYRPAVKTNRPTETNSAQTSGALHCWGLWRKRPQDEPGETLQMVYRGRDGGGEYFTSRLEKTLLMGPRKIQGSRLQTGPKHKATHYQRDRIKVSTTFTREQSITHCNGMSCGHFYKKTSEHCRSWMRWTFHFGQHFWVIMLELCSCTHELIHLWGVV